MEWQYATSDESNFRILSMNTNYANRHYQKILQLITDENPDVVAMIELSEPQLEALKSTLFEIYPYHYVSPANNPGGIGLFSKRPLRNTHFYDITKYQFGFISAGISIGQKNYNLLAVHLAPPICPECLYARVITAEAMQGELAYPDAETIMMGDFNNTIWTKDFLYILNTLDLKTHILSPPTWPNVPLIPKIGIDHILIPRDASLISIRRGPDIGSDHFPIIADVRL
jgi:endonuclease/exonuclease/phosphatase (EEP) superfamily protein YafD